MLSPDEVDRLYSDLEDMVIAIGDILMSSHVSKQEKQILSTLMKKVDDANRAFAKKMIKMHGYY